MWLSSVAVPRGILNFTPRQQRSRLGAVAAQLYFFHFLDAQCASSTLMAYGQVPGNMLTYCALEWEVITIFVAGAWVAGSIHVGPSRPP